MARVDYYYVIARMLLMIVSMPDTAAAIEYGTYAGSVADTLFIAAVI